MNLDEMNQIEGGMEIFGYDIFKRDINIIEYADGSSTYTRSWRWHKVGEPTWGTIWDNEKND